MRGKVIFYIILFIVLTYTHVQILRAVRTDTFASPAISSTLYVETNNEMREVGQRWEGVASYYSRTGCIGCSPSLTMANGESLDDTRLTVAFNHVPLNSYVRVTNIETGESVVAQVTDTGGFERLGRIVDLTVATRDAISCDSLCDVIVEEIK